MFAVAGITGKTGAVVARTLLDSGRRVRGLVRHAQIAAPWATHEGFEARVVPTLADYDALAPALEGVEGAYFLLPTDLRSESFLAQAHETEDVIARAVQASGVPRVVHLSSIGAQHQDGTGPIRALHYAEQRLADTGVRLTLLRAALFLENWAPFAGAARNGTLPSFVPAELACPMVCATDIGRVAAQSLLQEPSERSVDVIELAGTREVSARDVATIFAELFGRRVAVEQVLPADVAPMLRHVGVSADLSELYRELYEGVASGLVAWEGAHTRALRGSVTPEEVLRAFV